MKNLILMLLACFFVMTNAQAQFSYTHNNNTTISCKKTPLKITKDEGELNKKYVELADSKIMLYSTYAKTSTPNELTSVSVETIPLSSIKFDKAYFSVTVESQNEQKPMTIFFTDVPSQVSQNYLNKNGVKSKEEFTPNNYVMIEFPTHALARDFVNQVISKIPVAKQGEANTVFTNAYYAMMGEEKRQKDMKEIAKNSKETNTTNKVVSKDEILKDGSTYSFKGKTCYKYKYAFYDSNFEEFGRVSGSTYRFGGVEMYNSNSSRAVSKGTKVIGYCDIGKAFYDANKSNLYLKQGEGILYKSIAKNKNEQLGTYKSSSYVASMLTIEDIVVLVDYFGL